MLFQVEFAGVGLADPRGVTTPEFRLTRTRIARTGVTNTRVSLARIGGYNSSLGVTIRGS